jgi:hypothetical protein
MGHWPKSRRGGYSLEITRNANVICGTTGVEPPGGSAQPKIRLKPRLRDSVYLIKRLVGNQRLFRLGSREDDPADGAEDSGQDEADHTAH